MNEVVRLAKLRNCEFIFLEVRESNTAALALYGSFGFKVSGRRNNYYRNPVENAIVMVKEI
jgi:ribosomal-protein-alanine N-acetyltransferase